MARSDEWADQTLGRGVRHSVAHCEALRISRPAAAPRETQAKEINEMLELRVQFHV